MIAIEEKKAEITEAFRLGNPKKLVSILADSSQKEKGEALLFLLKQGNSGLLFVKDFLLLGLPSNLTTATVRLLGSMFEPILQKLQRKEKLSVHDLNESDEFAHFLFFVFKTLFPILPTPLKKQVLKDLTNLHYHLLSSRQMHPTGAFDKGGRFYLEEKFECCEGIRSPSGNWPYSEMIHARTRKHVYHAIENWVESGFPLNGDFSPLLKL